MGSLTQEFVLDLADHGRANNHVSGIEDFILNDKSTIILDELAVYALTDTRSAGKTSIDFDATGGKLKLVEGVAGVDPGGQWVASAGEDADHMKYTLGNAELVVDTDIIVEVA